jgi:hypothetical protein
MIDQGTNGLSRGIWMSALQGLEDSARLTQAVFEPLCFDPTLVPLRLHNMEVIEDVAHTCAMIHNRLTDRFHL